MDKSTATAQFANMLDTYADGYAIESHFARDYGVFTGLHRLPESPSESLFKWYQPPVVGNTDPTKPVPHGPHTSAPGDPTIVSCQGVVNQEDNFYFYMKLPMPDTFPVEIHDYRRYQITSSNLPTWQALEFQWQLAYQGHIYNGAWQFSFPLKKVRYFHYTGDPKTNGWIDTSIAMPDFSSPVAIEAMFMLDPVTHTVTHSCISLDSTTHVVGITQPATPTKHSDKFTFSRQVDPLKKSSGACTLDVFDEELRYA